MHTHARLHKYMHMYTNTGIHTHVYTNAHIHVHHHILFGGLHAKLFPLETEEKMDAGVKRKPLTLFPSVVCASNYFTLWSYYIFII